MPFGVCSDCGHYYVLDAAPSPRWRCPRCEQPLRAIHREEALTHLRSVRGPPRRDAEPARPDSRSGRPRRITVAIRRPASPADGWRVEMLGWLRVTHAGQVISHFRSRRTGALLAYLAYYRDCSHPRELLVELLWPEADPKAGKHNLRTELSSLRRQLEPPGRDGAVFLADGVTLQFNPGCCVTDVAAFEAALRSATTAAAGGSERQQQLLKAVQLYRGELLPGHFESWVLSERLRLLELFLQALGELAAHREQAGDLVSALQWTWRAVAADPLREEAHAALLRLLVVTGQPAAAARQQQELERLLEYGLETAPAPPPGGTHAGGRGERPGEPAAGGGPGLCAAAPAAVGQRPAPRGQLAAQRAEIQDLRQQLALQQAEAYELHRQLAQANDELDRREAIQAR